MSNALFDKGREGIADDTISLPTGVLKTALVRGYTFGATHKFISDLTGAGGTLVATSGALTSKTFTDGVFDADDVTFTAVASGAAITDLVIFQASAVTGGADVAATAQRLVSHHDLRVTATATANSGATSIAVTATPIALPSGSTVSFSGGTVATLSASAAAGATTLTVTALGGAVASGETAVVVTPNGGDLSIQWPATTPKIFKL